MDLVARLRNVFWIGGGSGAGKSTIASRLASYNGLRLYATDDAKDHAGRTTADDAPALAEFIAMDMDERWVNRSPLTMLETFHWYRGEGFGLIVEDLLRLPSHPGVIVEGFRLLPHLVKPLLATPRQAVWLVPTPQFREAVFDGRGATAWGFVAKTSDPPTALRNLLERDRMFTERLAREAEDLGLTAIAVDGATTEDDLAHRVGEALGLRASDQNGQ
jgi:hypothetical protein